jgi:hypothetical protein
MWFQLGVGIATGYGLDGPGSIPGSVRFFFKMFLFSTASRLALGVHPASYPTGAGGDFPGGKTAEAWSWPFTYI